MIDPKFQPNPVVPKPKLPKATVINLNPNYQKSENTGDSKRILISVEQPQQKVPPAKKPISNEKNTAIFDFKKMISDGLEQSKNIFQNTTEVFKNVENKIQSRFKNEIVKSEIHSENTGTKSEKKEKKKFFGIPKSIGARHNNSTPEIKTKKNIGAQLVVLTSSFAAIFAAVSILVPFYGILNSFGADLKTIQWFLALFFLSTSTFALYSNKLISYLGSKRVLFDGLTLVFLGILLSLLASVFNLSIFWFILGVSILFGFGFASIFSVVVELFFYNSGLSSPSKSNLLFSKFVLVAIIISVTLVSLINNYFGWKVILGIDLFFVFLSIVNLNRISDIKENAVTLKLPFLDISLFFVANLFLSFGIIESLNYGWFFVKNPLELAGQTFNPKISASLISILFGIFVLGIRNMIQRKSIFSFKRTFDLLLKFIKSGFLGGLISLSVFGGIFVSAFNSSLPMLNSAFFLIQILFGIIISSFLVKNLSSRISSKNTKLLGLIIYIIGLIMFYFSVGSSNNFVSVVSPMLLIGVGSGLFLFIYDPNIPSNFAVEYSKYFSVLFFGLAFFWSFSSSNFNLTTVDNIIPESLKPDLFKSINTAKNLTACKIEPYNQNNLDELEANKIRRAICENFNNSIVEGSRTVITLAAVISVICFFVVMIQKESD